MDIELQAALRDDLKQVLTRYRLSEGEAEALVQNIWLEVEEAFDFAEFVDYMKQEPQVGTESIDLLAELDESAREALIKRHLAALTPEIRKGLSYSRGKWAHD